MWEYDEKFCCLIKKNDKGIIVERTDNNSNHFFDDPKYKGKWTGWGSEKEWDDNDKDDWS